MRHQRHVQLLLVAILPVFVKALVPFSHTHRRNTQDASSSTLVLGQTTTSTDESSTTTTTKRLLVVDFDVLKRDLERCVSGTQARRVMEEQIVKPLAGGDENGRGALYGSVVIPPDASDRGISDGDLAIQTKIRNKKYGIFDLIDMNGDKDADRASASVLSVFLASTFSAIAINENLPGPEIIRFIFVWLLSFAPLAFVGYGIATPETLQAILVSIQRELFPAYRQRMIQHEAGHFLMAHLLGYPVEGYTTNAVKNAVAFYPLNDQDAGPARARMLGFDSPALGRRDEDDYFVPKEDVPFFSKDGRGGATVESMSVFRKDKNYTDNPFLKLPSQNQPQKSWPYRGFDHTTVDQLSVVSVAGVCSEVLAFGNAEGGVADFSQMRQFFASAEPELTEREIDNRIRYSVGFAMTQLRLHLGALDALAEVMKQGGSVAECVKAIETCSNISGDDGIFGDYDYRRRQEFKKRDIGIFEKLFLGEKNADTEETRLVEGKGGGGFVEKRKLINISGDDPLYIAGGIALLFFAWAANGGLSLH